MISYIANLRVFAMSAGLFVHVILFLVPATFYPWQIKSPTLAPWASVVVLYIYAFQTSIFFSLAGYFGKYLYQNSGKWKFLQERFIRIGLPFLLSIGITMLGYLPYLTNVYYKNSAVTSFEPFLASLTFTGVLWFLYYLCWFYLLMAVGAGYLLNYLSAQLMKYFYRFSASVLLLYTSLFLGSFMLAIMLTAQSVLITPSLTLVPHWDFFYYFLFFCCGWLGYKNRVVLKLISKKHAWLFMLTTITVFPLFSFLFLSVWPYHQNFGLRLLINLLETVNAISMLLGIYSVFYHYLNRDVVVLHFSARASFWCYYAQYPVVIALQTCFLPTTLSSGVKVICIFAGTLAILLFSYGFWEKISLTNSLHSRRDNLQYLQKLP